MVAAAARKRSPQATLHSTGRACPKRSNFPPSIATHQKSLDTRRGVSVSIRFLTYRLYLGALGRFTCLTAKLGPRVLLNLAV